MYIFILIGIVGFILFLKYLITHWKTLKKNIIGFLNNNIGSILYIIFLFIFIVFMLYPFLQFNGNEKDKIKSIDLLEFSNKYRTAMILLLIVFCFIFGIWTIMTLKKMPSMRFVYIIQGIIIVASIVLNTYHSFDTFPYIPYVGEIKDDILRYIFWIFFLGILAYFSYYLINYKESKTNTTSVSGMGNSTMKYLSIFIILLFTTKLFFKNQKEDIDAGKMYNNLLFSGGDPVSTISVVSYGFIITNIIYFIFNWGFIKWFQAILIGIILVFIICILLFNLLLKFTNPEIVDPVDFDYFNTNYIFLTIIFLFVFLCLFKFDPSNILQSPLSYLYIIGFVLGLIILVSLSIIFNTAKTTESIFNGKYANYIKRGAIIFISIVFFTFFIFYIRKAIKSAQKNINESALNATSTFFNICILVGIFIGLYYLSNFLHKSPYANILFLVGVITIFIILLKTLINTFDSHISTSNCSNINLWKWQEYSTIIFSIIGVFSLSSVKKDVDVNYTELLLLLGFIVLGYYLGGFLYNVKHVKNEKKDCSGFAKKTGISFLETIKSTIVFSIIVTIFFSMNVLLIELNKNYDPKNKTDNLSFFLGLFFVILFIVYFLSSNTCFIYIFGLLKNLFNRDYFSSPNTHKLTDFLFLFAMIFIFFSSMGLLERVSISNILHTPLDYIKEFLDADNSSYKSLIFKIYYMLVLVFNMIMFIPCIFNDMYSYIYKSVKNNPTNPVIYVLIAEACLICFYIFYKSVISKLINRHSSVLLLEPTWLDTPTKIQTTHINYNFGLSFWIYIEPGMTNNTFLNILNYNDSPAVSYKPSMNSLVVTSQLNPENTDVEYRKKGVDTENTFVNENIKSFTTLNNNTQEGYEKRKIIFTYDVALQTWCNFFINYNSGVIDVFVNGILMSSSSGNMFDANTYKNHMTIGEDEIQIKMCNLCLYDKNLNVDEIMHVYDKSKNVDPPTKK